MKSQKLFDDGDHIWMVLGRDPERRGQVIDTNELVIVSRGQAMLLDPGGIEIFPHVLAGLAEHISVEDIRVLFASHQDPDIISSLSMWLDLCPGVPTYCSRLWTGFISHFCTGVSHELTPIPDEGMPIPIGESGREVHAIPAHFCHASGNFSIWDPHARIVFTGDIGAALLPSHDAPFFVEDFGEHIQYMEGFHRRWMPSSQALADWAQRVRALEPRMLCPQHGSIFRDDDVYRFLDWIEKLEVGRWE